MTANYQGMTHRTLTHAIFHLLEQDYALLGSRRILTLLAEDLQKLVAQFYPPNEHLQPGWLLFSGTHASGPKAQPGQSAGDLKLVTISWPLLTRQDINLLAQMPETKAARPNWFRQRLIRLIEHGWQHPDGPVLLTVADLAAMTGLTCSQVSDYLYVARKQTGKPLLTKGYFFDQGLRPTHKADIITLYEQGVNERDIAIQTNHSQQSVGRYIRDYERVKLLVNQGFSAQQIRQLTDLLPNVISTYTDLFFKLCPDQHSISSNPT